MKGHGAKFEYRREHAIAALLSCDTIAGAAKACGVAPVTLWRWLQDPSFEAQYRAARKQVVERAVSDLQLATAEAVMTLRRNLSCGNVAVEVRAAQIIIDQVFKRESHPDNHDGDAASDEEVRLAIQGEIRRCAEKQHMDEAEAAWELFQLLRDHESGRRLELWPESVAERNRLLLTR